MKKKTFLLLLFFLSANFLCCSQESENKTNILAKINDYHLTVDEFDNEITRDFELDDDFKITDKAKRDFLEEIIRKQILIQEAKRLHLDTKDEFMRAIQRYWESTLIRNLIELKGKEINNKTYISQEEIRAHYDKMTNGKISFPPLEDIEKRIKYELIEQKKTKILQEWIDDLTKKAKIEINEELL